LTSVPKKSKKKTFVVLVVGRFFLSPDDAFRSSRLALGPFFGPWCLSVDTVYVGLPLYIDFRGLFTQ
jgi:hypothetical protein